MRAGIATVTALGLGLSAFALSELTACGSTSHVVRAGKDTYMVSAGAGIYTENPSGIRQNVYEAANAYCGNTKKTMQPVDTNEQPYVLGRNTASISLTFKCE